jgi:hypothetical protein
MFSRELNNFDKHLDTSVSFGSSCLLNAASVLRLGSSSPVAVRVHLDSYFMSVAALVFLILRLRISGLISPCLPRVLHKLWNVFPVVSDL